MMSVLKIELTLRSPLQMLALCVVVSLTTFTLTKYQSVTTITLAPTLEEEGGGGDAYTYTTPDGVASQESQSHSDPCKWETLDLFPLSGLAIKEADENGEEKKMFILETSGLAKMSPRAACAVESAAEQADVFVLVMMLSPYLDLKDNTTCQLYKNYASKNVRFYRIMPDKDFAKTPLYDLYLNDTFSNSKHTIVHLSDALRIAYIVKYGGWYADSDFIFVKPISHFRNVITANAINERAEADVHQHITTGSFNLDKGHQLLKNYMKDFRRDFKGKGRAEVGPMKFSMAIRKLCKYPGNTSLLDLKDISVCNLIALEPNLFYPFRTYQVGDMWKQEGILPEEWDARIAGSVAVHFYGGLTRNRQLSGDPSEDIYSYLAPKYCPLSYFSAEIFK